MNLTAYFSKLYVIALCIVAAASFSYAETGAGGRKLLKLEGPKASVTYDLAGGSMADFHRTKDGLNPFTWNRPERGDTYPGPWVISSVSIVGASLRKTKGKTACRF